MGWLPFLIFPEFSDSLLFFHYVLNKDEFDFTPCLFTVKEEKEKKKKK